MAKGFDCARPVTATQARQLAAMGFTFAARYLVPARLAWKRLIREEAEAITAAGMQVVSVFETSANRPSGGATAGHSDGVEAFNEAHLIKQPLGSAIYFAVDYDASPKDYDLIEQYLRAAKTAIGGYRVGVYGSASVIDEMARRKAADCFWQTYAWSHGVKSKNANIYQYSNGQDVSGVSLDLNESFGGEGWWNTKAPVVVKPTPDEEDEPNLKKADADKVIALLSAAHGLTNSKEARDEVHRLANELRKASGQPTT